MEEIEVPTEQLHENMEEEAEHGPKWITYTALSSAVIAVLAAISALLAGVNANEAMLSQIQASDQWSFYQAKSIKSNLLESKIELDEAVGKNTYHDREKLAEYKKEESEIKEKAEELGKESGKSLKIHEILARSVTLFQVAIAIGAIAALTRKKHFWFVSLGFGLIGLLFFIQSFLA